MRLVTVAQWGARVSQLPTRNMKLPAKELWLHHSVTAVTDDPTADMKVIERVGISRFGHISYSYAVHPHGTVLEGAGTKVGAHTAGRNSTSFGVVWIGDYDHRTPTKEQVQATRELIDHLIRQKLLKPGAYPTGGHRDVKGAATACPGANAHQLLGELRVPWVELPPPVTMEVRPRLNFTVEGTVVDALKAPDGGVWVLTDIGAIYAFECQDHGAPNRHPEYWQPSFRAARLQPLGDGYTVVRSEGSLYDYPA